MSALFNVAFDAADRRLPTVERLRRSHARQGFGAGHTVDHDGGTLVWYPTPTAGAAAADRAFLRFDNGFIACVGTLFYDGAGRDGALRRLWDDFREPKSISTDRLFGGFLVAIGKHGKVWLFGDRIGLVKLYTVPRSGVLGTSWLACLDALEQPRLDPFGASEYVLLGANHGDRTPVAGIGIADPACARELGDGRALALTEPGDWLSERVPSSPGEAVERIAAILASRFTDIGASYGGRIRCALSGGFDSRLIVASLLHCRLEPDVFVYGSRDSADVVVAEAAARAVGLRLRHVDKQRLEADGADDCTAAIAANLDYFDGIPPDGIEDLTADRQTRDAQSRDDHIALNGGGGEIFRNFFYLPDRRYSAADIEQTFYRPYAAAVFRDRGRCHEFRQRMVESIAAVTGPGSLDRAMVELIYPLFRNRFWASRNNSLAARVGAFLTPFIDAPLVRASANLPLAWKNHGRLEASLIARMNGALGSVPLAYGFTPAAGPGWAYRLRSALAQQRPPALRGRSAQIRSLLKRRPVEAPPHLRPLLEGAPAIGELLVLDALARDAQLVRALTLEALIRSRGIGVGGI